MAIKLELYRVFKEVADCGSISSAAKKLYISQSAVSQTIKQLEEMLQVRLFFRATRGVTLTQEGLALYKYVASAISLIETGEQRIAFSKSLTIGELVIGASDTITSSFLVKYLDIFHRTYSGVRLKVLNGTTPEVLELLHSGKVDIAFGNLPINDATINIHRCFDIHDAFITTPSFLGGRSCKMTLQEIAAMPVIMLERKSNSRIFVEQFFHEHGVMLTPEIELGSYDVVINLTKIGLGMGCVIREFCEPYLQKGELLEITPQLQIPSRSIAAFTLKNMIISPACEKFLEMVVTQVSNMEG